ncbi:TIR protein [Candidatus Magnetomorum sp. HK-1]|nr:TIR protein [Candidatus Magnetomorum sp. HK-1]
MKQYLTQIKENISNMGYFLYIIHDPTIFYILDEWICDDKPISIEYISLFDFYFNQTKNLILTSKANDQLSLSISQMEQLKNILLDIHVSRSDYDLILILYYLDHAAFSKDNNYFPDKFHNDSIWEVSYLPEKTDLSDVYIHPSSSDRLFKPFAQCLYDETHYKQIAQKTQPNTEHNTVVELKLHKDMASLYDMIKYDSIRNIQNEKINADMIRSNLASGLLYLMRKTYILKGEYTGALCACADTFDSRSLKRILYHSSNYDDLKNTFHSLFSTFEQLYSLNDTINKNATIEKYIQKIISIPLEIMSFQKPLQSPGKNTQLSVFSWNDLFETNKKEDYIFELFDILPDFKDIDRYQMIFRTQVNILNVSIDCHIHYTDREPMWRENFSAAGIEVGKQYALKNVQFENFLSFFLDTLAELKLIDSGYDLDNKDEKQKYRTELANKEYVKLIDKSYVNPSKCIQDTKTFEELTDDHCKLAHGKSNLDNILFVTKSSHHNPILTDLAYLATDYPASFDMVTLEMEIKNHIIANYLLVNFYKTEKQGLMNLLIQIEDYINSEGEITCLLEQPAIKMKKTTQKSLYQMINFILFIRKKAYQRYQRSSTEQPKVFEQNVKIRYRQQLFFHSIRLLEYRSVVKPSRFYAAITALLTANELFGRHYQMDYPEPDDGSSSYVRKHIFISYCHEDRKYLNQLKSTLDVLTHKNIHSWYDKDIKTGDQWDLKIHTEIEKADMAVCLITENFLKSKYIRDTEIPAILNRRQESLKIFPILFEECMWNLLDWLKEIQMFPEECKPVKDFSANKQNEQLKEFAGRIAEALGVQ